MVSADKQSENSEARARSLANLRPFPKGQSGNPKGRPKSITLSEAYRKELAKTDEDDPGRRTKAEVLAEQIYLKAKGGDVSALREMADRVEGKARQTVQLSVGQRDKLERAVSGIMTETNCTREEAVAALAMLRPEAGQLIG